MIERFNVLDSFRGLSALCVVIFHLSIFNGFSELSFFRNGFYFVDFFFALSGFVLAHSYSGAVLRPFKSFILARFFRLYPLHLFMFFVFLLLEVFKLVALKFGFVFNNSPFSGSTAISEILPNLLLLQAWSPFTHNLSFNYVSWSISIEFYLYIIFYITLLFGRNFRLISWFFLASVMLFFILEQSTFLVSYVESGVFGFFSGVLIYQAFVKCQFLEMNNSVLFSFLEILSITIIIVCVSINMPFHAVILKALFGLVIFIFAFEKGILSGFLLKPIFQLFGKLSFSIYMIHGSVIFCIVSLIIIIDNFTLEKLTFMQGNQRFITTGSILGDNLLILFIISSVIYLSAFSYKYIELKGIGFGKRISNTKIVSKAL